MLAQRVHHLRELERRDGIKRVFLADADRVAREVPAYGAHVADQVARLGRQHPIVKTQYYLEEISSEGGLFPEQRRALMYGDHPRRHSPEAGHRVSTLCRLLAWRPTRATRSLPQQASQAGELRVSRIGQGVGGDARDSERLRRAGLR